MRRLFTDSNPVEKSCFFGTTFQLNLRECSPKKTRKEWIFNKQCLGLILTRNFWENQVSGHRARRSTSHDKLYVGRRCLLAFSPSDWGQPIEPAHKILFFSSSGPTSDNAQHKFQVQGFDFFLFLPITSVLLSSSLPRASSWTYSKARIDRRAFSRPWRMLAPFNYYPVSLVR